ncbi:MAG: hypothetical protein WDO15_01925 [Bacteroidota bacterium]
MKNLTSIVIVLLIFISHFSHAQEATVRVTQAGGAVYMLDGQGEFTGW